MGKQKQWRREAYGHNKAQTEKDLENKDIPPGTRTRHTGRRHKSDIGNQWKKGMYPLLEALFKRAGLIRPIDNKPIPT